MDFEGFGDSEIVVGDHARFERLLFSILENAYQYSLQHGKVKILVTLDRLGKMSGQLRVRVTDEGLGMDKQK